MAAHMVNDRAGPRISTWNLSLGPPCLSLPSAFYVFAGLNSLVPGPFFISWPNSLYHSAKKEKKRKKTRKMKKKNPTLLPHDAGENYP